MRSSIIIFILLSLIGVIFLQDCENFIATASDENSAAEYYMTWRQLKNCLIIAGRNPLNENAAKNIWRKIKAHYDGFVENIPSKIFEKMGWILNGIPVDDLYNVTIDDVAVLKAFGSYRGMERKKMEVIAEKVRYEWANKTPEKYSHYDLMILRQILCYFNESEILRIHADAYREAAETLGKLKNCSQEILQSFAELAVQDSAFGRPESWSQLTVRKIGIVIAGLTPDEYARIKPESLDIFFRKNNQMLNIKSTR